jgi:hypothetical protein
MHNMERAELNTISRASVYNFHKRWRTNNKWRGSVKHLTVADWLVSDSLLAVSMAGNKRTYSTIDLRDKVESLIKIPLFRTLVPMKLESFT